MEWESLAYQKATEYNQSGNHGYHLLAYASKHSTQELENMKDGKEKKRKPSIKASSNQSPFQNKKYTWDKAAQVMIDKSISDRLNIDNFWSSLDQCKEKLRCTCSLRESLTLCKPMLSSTACINKVWLE